MNDLQTKSSLDKFKLNYERTESERLYFNFGSIWINRIKRRRNSRNINITNLDLKK